MIAAVPSPTVNSWKLSWAQNPTARSSTYPYSDVMLGVAAPAPRTGLLLRGDKSLGNFGLRQFRTSVSVEITSALCLEGTSTTVRCMSQECSQKQTCFLFNHVVSSRQKRGWNGKPKCVRSSRI